MTPEAQRIAIAEACGWKRARSPLQSKSDPVPRCWSDAKGAIRLSLPDYLGSLDAMHEAEKVLKASTDDYDRWINTLYDITKPPRDGHGPYSFAVLKEVLVIRATAAQRAEAFLRTIGKWKEAADV